MEAVVVVAAAAVAADKARTTMTMGATTVMRPRGRPPARADNGVRPRRLRLRRRIAWCCAVGCARARGGRAVSEVVVAAGFGFPERSPCLGDGR